ncbi:amino acid synthesis family protein [Micromonospora sp. NPDC048830]|uniref:amino acid synthesis family protein n=1 Tax=Micromonospora sp. NPDC048830 TaxID=3364257 RepID=UPI003711E3F4
MSELQVRKIRVVVDEALTSRTGFQDGPPLRKVAACAVVRNPFAGRGHVEDLSEVTAASAELGRLLGKRCIEALGGEAESYGKAGIVGVAGEQEHVHAALTSVFGDPFRAAIGGGQAWITSTKKVGTVGTTIDVPLAFKDEIWVRSHYDTVTVAVPDGPLPDEMVVIAAVANRGRIGARVGGLTKEEALRRLDQG